MRPFETADVAFLETLKARQETLKAEFTAAERAQDAEHAAKITTELREMADKASAELLRFADRLATLTEARSRPWWRRLVGYRHIDSIVQAAIERERWAVPTIDLPDDELAAVTAAIRRIIADDRYP